jgi:hypothetical protein
MIVGGEKITETAAKLRAIVEADSENELVEIDDAFVIAVVHYGDPDDEHSSSSLFYRCTSARYHIQLGILEHTRNAVDAQQRTPDE